MRLFFIEWSGPEPVRVTAELSKKHDIIYWSGLDLEKYTDTSTFPGTIFHEYADALAGRPARGVATENFIYPGEDLLAELSETESIVLTMMNKKYEWMEVLERKDFYYKLVWYWEGVLETYAPDAIIFPIIPHTVYDFVIYALAQRRGIKTIMFDFTRVGHRLLLQNDFKEGSRRLKQEMENVRGRHFTLNDLSPDVQRYYEQEAVAAGNDKPQDVQGLIDRYTGLNRLMIKFRGVFASIKDLSIFKRGVQYIIKQFTSNLKKEHSRFETAVNWQEKFIYVPLHYQPECTTSPMGGVFVDQILMIEILAASLPKGWVVYVKEHPFQWLPRGLNYFNYRYRGYYERISKIKNVKLVPIGTSTFTLIKQAQAVATATGTAGWEAVFRGKPALCFGYPWYRHCLGVFKVSDVTSCRQVLEKIVGSLAVDHRAVIDYLAAFDRASVRGYVEYYGREISTVSEQENIINLVKALAAELEHS
ncbi:MAG: hypothetical protein HY983_00780 [Candidatus Magasanikbacteria bacterium]|nr:hypothetical protein [Candidatus Magasanikbacteria bacterium]